MNPDFHTTALLINNDGMGHGDEALRRRLLGNYLKTLIELEAPPQAILFYAAGVKMAAHDSPCRAELTRLREAGSQIVLCRTCLEHYGLMERVPADEIGNMLMIVEAQDKASRIITL